MNLEDTKKKETVRISKKDLLRLLTENEQMSKQITSLLEENKILKGEKPTEKNDPNDLLDPFPHPFINPDIYFDGALDAATEPRFRSTERR